jgi:hypothetical protein
MHHNSKEDHQLTAVLKLTILEELQVKLLLFFLPGMVMITEWPLSASAPQLEFPSLDSSLIAAFLSERNPGSLTKRQLRKLRRTLAELATGAAQDEQLISETLLGTHIDGSSTSSSPVDRSHEGSSSPSTVTDASSRSASVYTTSISSLLGFLQAVFPEIPPAHLERVITDANCDEGIVDGVDVERIVQLLLTQEYPEDPGDDGSTFGALENARSPESRGEGRVVNAKGRKRKNKFKPVALYDIRQQQHADEGAPDYRHGSRCPKISDVDIWTSVSSISAQLATLLHPHSESFFKSFFHSPESKTPATAVRRALAAITGSQNDDVSPPDMTVLLNLQDILQSTSEYNELSEEEQKRLSSDAHLCLQAVGSRIDNAFDLVWLLHSLEADDAAGWKMGPYHQEPLPCQDNCILETSKNTVQQWPRLPSQPQDGWNVVSSRKRPTAANRHSVSILASHDSHGASTRQIGFEKDTGPARLKERRDDLESRLREASMSAARAWKGGNSKNTRKQVALYHVDEVRMFSCTGLAVSAEDRSRFR